MKVVRGREDARWLPSRYHFAIFRLAAFLRLRKARPRHRTDLVLFVDHGQTAVEHYTVSLWVFFTLACYVAAGLRPAAMPLSLLMTATLVQVVIVVGGGGVALWNVIKGSRATTDGIRANSLLIMFGLIVAAAYYATSTSWVRFAAWQFLAMVMLNAIAAAAVFLLRHRIARLEEAFAV